METRMFIFSCTVYSKQHWEEMKKINAKENVVKNIEQEGCTRSIASIDNSTVTIMNFLIIIIHYNNYDLTSVSALSIHYNNYVMGSHYCM